MLDFICMGPVDGNRSIRPQTPPAPVLSGPKSMRPQSIRPLWSMRPQSIRAPLGRCGPSRSGPTLHKRHFTELGWPTMVRPWSTRPHFAFKTYLIGHFIELHVHLWLTMVRSWSIRSHLILTQHLCQTLFLLCMTPSWSILLFLNEILRTPDRI